MRTVRSLSTYARQLSFPGLSMKVHRAGQKTSFFQGSSSPSTIPSTLVADPGSRVTYNRGGSIPQGRNGWLLPAFRQCCTALPSSTGFQLFQDLFLPLLITNRCILPQLYIEWSGTRSVRTPHIIQK